MLKNKITSALHGSSLRMTKKMAISGISRLLVHFKKCEDAMQAIVRSLKFLDGTHVMKEYNEQVKETRLFLDGTEKYYWLRIVKLPLISHGSKII